MEIRVGYFNYISKEWEILPGLYKAESKAWEIANGISNGGTNIITKVTVEGETKAMWVGGARLY